MIEYLKYLTNDLVHDLADLDSSLVLLALIATISFSVLNAISNFAKVRRKEKGIDFTGATVSIDGSTTLPVRLYVSENLGLCGTPDAVVLEGGYIIPIERKPLARKIRDRYVAQLLVYMRLIEDCEGKKPPYGYLILGPQCRRVKIENSQSRQKWLDDIIKEMRAILQGGKAIPKPHPKKCCKCEVRTHCEFGEGNLVKLKSVANQPSTSIKPNF